MATSRAPSNISFTTTSTDYDLLQDTEVKDVFKALYNWDEDRYQLEVSKGFESMKFDIFVSGTEVKINDATRYESLIGDTVYTTEDFNRTKYKSIKIKDTGISGIFSFNRL